MENRAHALLAGMFVLVLGTALAIVALWFSGEGARFKHYLLITHASVSGLNPQASVRYRGVEVGKVEDIALDAKNPRQTFIRITVDHKVPVTRGTFAQLRYKGITGLAYVELNDDGSDPTLLATSSDKPGLIKMRASLLDELGASGQELITNLTELSERLNVALGDRNQQHLTTILKNVEEASGRFVVIEDALLPTVKKLPQTVDKISGAVSSADKFFSDANVMVGELKQSVKSIDRLALSAERMGAAGETVTTEILQTTLPRVHDLVIDMSRTSHSLEELARELNQRPQSLLFGKPAGTPGPGENGFSAQPSTEAERPAP